METAKRIMHGVRRFAWVGLFWLLCIFCAMPANAQAAQNTYYYPGYDAAANGPINLMQYIKSITLTVNGQEYTPEQLQSLQQSGTPLEMRVGDSASINFRFALCGRAYSSDDQTLLDEAASVHVTYTNGTTYLNGDSVAPGGTGILDDSSLMVDNTSAESSYLRLDIGWLLEFCPDDFSINYSEGGVSFQQKDNYLYL